MLGFWGNMKMKITQTLEHSAQGRPGKPRRRPPMAGQELVVLRHGLRFDEVEATWAAQAERPWDPPLAPEAIAQVLCLLTAAGCPVAHQCL